MNTIAQPAPCAISPKDKKAQAQAVGEDLVRLWEAKVLYRRTGPRVEPAPEG